MGMGRIRANAIRVAANLATVLVFAMLAGCASPTPSANPAQTEATLKQFGFRAMPVATPQQAQLVKSLPLNKLTPVRRNGKRYYVYPDQDRQYVLVGTDAQRSRYENYLFTQDSARFVDPTVGNPPGAGASRDPAMPNPSETLLPWESGWSSWEPE